MNRRRPFGKLRYIAFDSQFEVTPCVPEQRTVLDGINCRLVKYFVDYLPEGKRKTIAIYEETTAIDAQLETVDEREQQLWKEWESGKSEETLQAILVCIEKRCDLLGIQVPYQADGLEPNPASSPPPPA